MKVKITKRKNKLVSTLKNQDANNFLDINFGVYVPAFFSKFSLKNLQQTYLF